MSTLWLSLIRFLKIKIDYILWLSIYEYNRYFIFFITSYVKLRSKTIFFPFTQFIFNIIKTIYCILIFRNSWATRPNWSCWSYWFYWNTRCFRSSRRSRYIIIKYRMIYKKNCYSNNYSNVILF